LGIVSTDDRPPILGYARREVRTRLRFRFLTIFLILLGFVIAVLLVSMFLPASNPPYADAPQIHSASNLRQIGLAIMQYSNDNAGAFPDSFQTLLMKEELNSAVFVSPLTSDTPAQGPTTQVIASQLAAVGHLSYVYLGKGLTTKITAPDTIVAYERFSQSSTGTNILFGDFHVDWVAAATAAKIIAKAASGKFPVTMPSN